MQLNSVETTLQNASGTGDSSKQVERKALPIKIINPKQMRHQSSHSGKSDLMFSNSGGFAFDHRMNIWPSL